MFNRLIVLVIVPVSLSSALRGGEWMITHQTGDENVAADVAQHNDDVDKRLADLREQFNAIELDFARGRITARQLKEGTDRIRAMQEPLLEHLKWRELDLDRRQNARDNARKSSEKANQPHVLDANEQGMLRILDKAASDGKVPAESLAVARGIILSGAHDAQSVAHVTVAVAYCLSQLTDNEQERARYLGMAQDALESLKSSEAAGR
ncbi:MAG: hypothetical protein ABSG86_21945 [Thermoguttaceae bacterium]|jgi:hypothetical protein